MTNKFSLKILTAIAFLLVAQATHAQTVLDYYQKLPAKYFTGVAADSRARLKYVKIRDAKNGYLKIEKPFQIVDVSKLEDKDDVSVTEAENDAARRTAQIEVALFRHAQDKRHIVAVTYRYSADCPACAMAAIDFYEDRDGELRDVTEAILARVDAKAAFAEYARRTKASGGEIFYQTAEHLKQDLAFRLPRVGRTIRVATDSQSDAAAIELMNFRWTGSEFVSEPIERK